MKQSRNSKKPQMYVVRKYIMAWSAAEAIANEHKVPPRDVWLDDEWRKENSNSFVEAIGFDLANPRMEYEDCENNKKRI